MENRLNPPISLNQTGEGDGWSENQLHMKLSSLVNDLVHHNIDLHFARRELESMYISAVLRANHGNIGTTARALGMHRNTLSRRIKELQIQVQTPLP